LVQHLSNKAGHSERVKNCHRSSINNPASRGHRE
jgi:hypothetical protein